MQAWLADHPAKRPKPVATRKHVAHFYSNGDICDMTGEAKREREKERLYIPGISSYCLLR